MSLLIKGGEIVTGDEHFIGDIYCEHERITHIGRGTSAEVRDGTFTRELVEEFDAGRPTFLKRREAEQAEQIEQVGAKLRPLMSWLSDEED